MAKRNVPFNVKAFWVNIQNEKCKRKLAGALKNLERAMKRETATLEMYTCKVYLDGKLGKSQQQKLA